MTKTPEPKKIVVPARQVRVESQSGNLADLARSVLEDPVTATSSPVAVHRPLEIPAATAVPVEEILPEAVKDE